MKKAAFVRFRDVMKRMSAHISKTKAFRKVVDNPAGTKLLNRSKNTSRRGVDGTMR